MFGRVLDHVDLTTTNVLFTSDHGEGNMEHRQVNVDTKNAK